jgi:hypothetical protein
MRRAAQGDRKTIIEIVLNWRMAMKNLPDQGNFIKTELVEVRGANGG